MFFLHCYHFNLCVSLQYTKKFIILIFVSKTQGFIRSPHTFYLTGGILFNYFIHDTLCCDPEYTGNIALAVRYGGLKHHKENAIFNGDDFKFEVGVDGRRKLIHHKQSLESIGGDVIGAYVTYELEDGTQDMEIMNISQIRNSWLQGAAKGGSMAHKNFTDQMAIKTVYNRMTKLLIRASNDAPLMGDSGSDDNEQKPDVISEAKQEVIAKANAEEISFEDVSETPQASAESELAPQQEAPQSTNAQAKIPY